MPWENTPKAPATCDRLLLLFDNPIIDVNRHVAHHQELHKTLHHEAHKINFLQLTSSPVYKLLLRKQRKLN